MYIFCLRLFPHQYVRAHTHPSIRAFMHTYTHPYVNIHLPNIQY